MPSLEFVSLYLNEHCENVTEKNGKFHCRCPLCGDSKKSKRKKRFHLTFENERKIIYNCFNCNSSGTFTKLYAFFEGIDEEEAYKKFYGFESVLDDIKKPKKIKKEHKELIGTVNYLNFIEKDCISENIIPIGYTDTIALKILKKFRQDRNVPKEVKLWFCYDGKYKNRVIIPIYDKNEKIVYFQARAILPKQEPKYLNPESPKSIIIPNIERLDFSKPVVITEGLLDSFSISNGTTCLGKSITEDFIRELKKHNDDVEIILVYDNDISGIDARENFLYHNRYAKQVKYFLWMVRNIKDLNQLMKEKNLSIEQMDKVIKDYSYDYYDVMTIIGLSKGCK